VADQQEFKVSYYLESQESGAILSQIELLLQEQGMSVEVIYSSSRNLDILPARGDKGKAMAFIRKKLGIEPTATVACGDSGNDRALFENRPEKGIIVGNAQTELIEWHYQNQAENRYLAKAHYAKGILEGLTKFGFFQA
jgi:hypothetical protein